MEFVNDVDRTNDVVIEFLQFIRMNPPFGLIAAADLLDRVAALDALTRSNSFGPVGR